MSLTKVRNSMIQGAWFNALDYGAVGDGSTNNKAALQAAIDAMSAGDTLFIPNASSYYVVDATNLLEAVQVNKSINLVIDGEMRSTTVVTQSLPPAIFFVTADNVNFSGSGKLKGPGTYLFDNCPTDHWTSLIRFDYADNVSIDGLQFADGPRGGLTFYGCNFLSVTNCTFSGGPLADDAVGLGFNNANIFCSNGGKNWIISGNIFQYDEATGGAAIQGIQNSTNVLPELWTVTNNVFANPGQHGTYLYINNSVISNNVFRYTTVSALHGSALKMGGDYNSITGNTIFDANGGIGLVSGRYNVISQNTLEDCGGVGIAIYNNTAISWGLDGNEISSNYIGGDGNTAFQGIRIRFNTTYGTDHGGKNNKIINNTVVNYGSDSDEIYSSIAIYRSGGSVNFTNNVISGNTITESRGNGIALNGVSHSDVSDNLFYNNTDLIFKAIYVDYVDNITVQSNLAQDFQGSPTLSELLFSTANSSNIAVDDNFCYGATGAAPIPQNPTRNIIGTGNRLSYTDNLRGTFTMNNVAFLVVSNENILDASLTNGNSSIVIVPLNAAAATAMGSAKSLYVSAKVAKTSFTVTTADGASLPASDHIFSYYIF
tara:strand:- start:38 stop:1837 length:1800 start_codon:yes stop_codon:yes gene_type:complete